MTKVCYLYAIVAAEDTGSVWLPRGIDDQPAYAVVAGSLAGVVAELDSAVLPALGRSGGDWLARAVRAHDRVVRRVFSQVPLVPVRFGMTFATRAGVEEFLHRRSDHLHGSLSLVGDSAEWIVEISTVDTSDLPEPAAGKAWMRHHRAAVHVQQHQARLAAQAHHTLAGHTVSTCGKARPSRATYLVRRCDEPAFQEEAEKLSQPLADAGLALHVCGPLPAYHKVLDAKLA